MGPFKQKNDPQSSLKIFVAGGIAGAVAKSVIAPLDRIKILFMTNGRSFNYKEGFKEGYRIIIEEKFISFWKGNMAQLWRIVPYSAVQFGSYDRYRKIFDKLAWSQEELDKSLSKTALRNFLPGSLAGATGVIVSYPFELCRTRLAIQTRHKQYNGTFHAIPAIVKADGIQGLYRGITPTVVGILPYSGISFWIYFTLRDKSKKKNIASYLQYGAISGLIGQFLTYPFDILRKRMQAHGFIEQVSIYKASIQRGPKLDILLLVKEILQAEGIRGFWKGFSMNIIKAPIGAGIVHATNEIVNEILVK